MRVAHAEWWAEFTIIFVLGRKSASQVVCSRPQTALRKASVSALPTKHPVLSLPRPVLCPSPLQLQPTQARYRGETGVKTQCASGPFPLPSPLVSTRRLAWSRGSEPRTRGAGGNGLVSRVANPRARGASEEAPALGRPGAASFPRQSTNAPERGVWRPRRAQRLRSASPAPPPRVLPSHRSPGGCWTSHRSAAASQRHPSTESREPRAPQTPAL